MRILLAFSVMVVVSLITGCQAPVQRSASPVVKQMTVNGVSITYVEQGQGTPVGQLTRPFYKILSETASRCTQARVWSSYQMHGISRHSKNRLRSTMRYWLP